jgi:NAD(P)-dependent dehydrogenase (short-subunit alcohol dehydrogenase family)
MKAVIVGGTSGLGRALAAEFMAAGWTVAVTGVRPAALAEFSAKFPAALAFKLDVTATAAARARLLEIISGLGGVDAAVICAGRYDDDQHADWAVEERTIAVNASGCAAVLNAAFHYFLQKGGGRLACVSSIGGVRGNARCPAYNASKAFLFNYLEGLRQHAALAGTPVTITNAVPAYVGGALEPAARAILRAVLAGRRSVYVPGYWRLLAAAYRNLPDLLHEKMARWHYALLKPFMRSAPRR